LLQLYYYLFPDEGRYYSDIKMIKIVHIITGLTTGGAEMMLYKLLSGIDLSRFEPTVISLKDKGVLGCKIEELGVPVYSVEMSANTSFLLSVFRLSSFIRKIQPNIVQGWMYHGNIAAIITRLLLFKNIPMLWNIRHSLSDIRYEKKRTQLIINIAANCSNMPNKIIYNSKKSAVQHEQFGYRKNRTIVIPNGFDCSVFKPSYTARSTFRNKLSIKNNDILIGLICRYHPMKDHINFIKAAGCLAQKHENVYFVLAGRDVDESNLTIMELIKKSGLKNRFFILGERSDTPEINAGLDIACTSSAYGEAFPNVVGEAMACGVPCVVTDVGDSAWIVGKTGKVVPPRNSELLAKAWEALIDAGSVERERLGEKARQRVLDFFSIEKIINQYEVLYELINKR